MSFWNTHRESELERELRAQRPQPSQELVRRLGGEHAVPVRRRHSVAPRIAAVAAASTVFAASLGVAGAVGFARPSLDHFGTGVVRLVTFTPAKVAVVSHVQTASPATQKSAVQPAVAQPNVAAPAGKIGGLGGLRNGQPPYTREYGLLRLWICLGGHPVAVPYSEFVYLNDHGVGGLLRCLLGGHPPK